VDFGCAGLGLGAGQCRQAIFYGGIFVHDSGAVTTRALVVILHTAAVGVQTFQKKENMHKILTM
jgi:hypothetical protein